MTRKKLTLIFVVSITTAIFAQTSLQTCLTIAQKNNLDLAVSRLEIESATQDLIITNATLWPQINASAGLTQSLNSSDKSGSVGLSLSQKLFPSPFLTPEISRSKLLLDSKKEVLKLAETTVRLSVSTAFIQLFFDQETIKLDQKILKRREQNTKLIYARYQAGRENKGTYSRANAQLSQSQTDFKQSQRNIAISQNTLKSLLQISEDIDPENEKATDIPTTIDHNNILENHPTIKLRKLLISAAEAAIKASTLNTYPDLTGSLSGSQSLYGGSFNSSASLELSLPLWTGGRLSAQTELAKLNLTVQKISYQSDYSSLSNQLNEAFIGLVNAKENLEVQKQLLESARLRSDISQAQYNAGLLSYESWDIIENDLITQEKNSLNRERDLLVQTAKFEFAKGRGL